MSRFARILISGCLGLLLSEPASAQQLTEQGAVPPSIEHLFDADQVLKWQPDADGRQFRLGSDDLNHAQDVWLEAKGPAILQHQQGLTFWRVAASAAASRSAKKTAAVSLFMLKNRSAARPLGRLPESAKAAETIRTERSGTTVPNGLHDAQQPDSGSNLEMTVFIRVGQPETFSLTRQQSKSSVLPNTIDSVSQPAARIPQLRLGLCRGKMIFAATDHQDEVAGFMRLSSLSGAIKPASIDSGAVTPLARKLPLALEPDHWFGLKLISWQDRSQPLVRHYQLYLDPDPFEPGSGTPHNRWQLFSEYAEPGQRPGSAGQRSADGRNWWGSVDVLGYRQVDFALPSVRTIVAPQSLP